MRVNSGLTTAVAVALLMGCSYASAQHSNPCERVSVDTYERVLDAYFENARGNSPSAIVLRIYGGLYPEYEVVLDPQISDHKIFRYGPVRSIYGKAYDGWNTGNPRRTLSEYVARAKKIPIRKQEFEIPELEFSSLVERQKHFGLTTCGNEPLLNSEGKDIVVIDVSTYELITDSGRKRSAVPNTLGGNIVSPNPDLLNWATEIRKLATLAN